MNRNFIFILLNLKRHNSSNRLLSSNQNYTSAEPFLQVAATTVIDRFGGRPRLLPETDLELLLDDYSLVVLACLTDVTAPPIDELGIVRGRNKDSSTGSRCHSRAFPTFFKDGRPESFAGSTELSDEEIRRIPNSPTKQSNEYSCAF